MRASWRRRAKAGLATVFALSLTVTQSGLQDLAVQAAEVTPAVTAEVYPKPQNITIDPAEGMNFVGGGCRHCSTWGSVAGDAAETKGCTGCPGNCISGK